MAYFSIKANAVAAAAAVLVLVVQTAAFAAAEKDQPKFDYFMLALPWSGYSCSNISSCCPFNGCCGFEAESPARFTIHGLWPEYEGGKWPSCCTDEKFDPNALDIPITVLLRDWPTYRCSLETSCNDRKASFWAAQYEKHGTCAAPVINNQHDYFSKALELFHKYDVTEMLEKAGIVASLHQPYPLPMILQAVRFAFNGIPRVTCGENRSMKELMLCFRKDWKPRDCPASDSCPPLVWLPPKKKPLVSNMGGGAIPRLAEIAEAVI